MGLSDGHHSPINTTTHYCPVQVVSGAPELSPIELGTDIAKEFFDERSDKNIGSYRGHVFDIDEHEKDGSVLYHVMYEDE